MLANVIQPVISAISQLLRRSIILVTVLALLALAVALTGVLLC